MGDVYLPNLGLSSYPTLSRCILHRHLVLDMLVTWLRSLLSRLV